MRCSCVEQVGEPAAVDAPVEKERIGICYSPQKSGRIVLRSYEAAGKKDNAAAGDDP